MKEWMMRHKTLSVTLLFLLAIAIAVCAVHIYTHSTKAHFNEFQNVFSERYDEARQGIETLQGINDRNQYEILEDLERQSREEAPITYCVYRFGIPVYWSSGQVDMPSVFELLSSSGVMKIGDIYYYPLLKGKGPVLYVALIALKVDYEVQSPYLVDHFFDGYRLDAYIGFCEGDAHDEGAIFSPDGDYLFSLDDTHGAVTDDEQPIRADKNIDISSFVRHWISPVEMYQVSDISWRGVLVIASIFLLIWTFVFLLWRFKKRRQSSFRPRPVPTLLIIAATSLIFVVANRLWLDHRERDVMLSMAHDIESNEYFARDIEVERFFERLDSRVINDRYVQGAENVRSIAEYFERAFMNACPKDYALKVSFFPSDRVSLEEGSSFRRYSNLIATSTEVAGTHFFFCGGRFAQTQYIAYFPHQNGVLFIEFIPKGELHSFSFPDGLMGVSDNSPERHFSFARYVDGRLISHGGRFRYPESERLLRDNFGILRRAPLNGEMVRMKRHAHFCYSASDGSLIIVSGLEHVTAFSLIFYSILVFMIGVLTTCALMIVRWLYCRIRIGRYGRQRGIGLMRRQQLVFSSLLFLTVLSIECIFYFYIRSIYQTRHVNQQEVRTRYVQKYLQQMLPDETNVRTFSDVDWAFRLDDLSRAFETDIHLYDASGRIVASSQPVMVENNMVDRYLNPRARRMRGEGAVAVVTERLGQIAYFSTFAPVINKRGATIGYLNIPSAISQAIMQREISDLMAVVLGVGILVTIVLYVVLMLLSERLTRPLRDLTEGLRDLNIQKVNRHLRYDDHDEIGVLVDQYNVLVDRLDDAVEQLAQAERKSAWRLMARQVAHEIKNPLTPIKLNLQMMQSMVASGSLDSFVAYFKKQVPSLIEQIDGLARIATSFSDYAKMPDPVRERLSIVTVLQTVVQTASQNEFDVHVSLSGHEQGDVTIYADKNQLLQIFNNLVRNAEQAIPQGRQGQVNLSLSHDDKEVVVKVIDNGTGIAEEIQGRIFMPNFTTKTSGMGLGLAIVKTLVETNGGSITFETHANEGSIFEVRFPLVESPIAVEKNYEVKQ